MKAIDIANYLLTLTVEIYTDMTNDKLNALLYYAQGYSFQRFGAPLFDDAIEAWERGPVVREVYDSYKAFGTSSLFPIPYHPPIILRSRGTIT